jgi:anti-anti-sigma factor
VRLKRPPATANIDVVVCESTATGLTLRVHGELDAATADVLRAALDGADGVADLVVDLADTAFGDLRGVQELVRCARLRGARQERLTVLNPPSSMESILRLTPLGRQVHWEPRSPRRSTRR